MRFNFILYLSIVAAFNIAIPLNLLYASIYNPSITNELLNTMILVNIYLMPILGLAFVIFYVRDWISITLTDLTLNSLHKRKASTLSRHLELIEQESHSQSNDPLYKTAIIALIILVSIIGVQYALGVHTIDETRPSTAIALAIMGFTMAIIFGKRHGFTIFAAMSEGASSKTRKSTIKKRIESLHISIEVPDYILYIVAFVGLLICYSVYLDVINQLSIISVFPTKLVSRPLVTSESINKTILPISIVLAFTIGAFAVVAYYCIPMYKVADSKRVVIASITSTALLLLIDTFFSPILPQFIENDLPSWLISICMFFGISLLGYVVQGIAKRLISAKHY